jgi:hypothetical protein
VQEVTEFINALGGWGEIGAGGVVIFIIFMILKGKLVPETYFSFLKDERDDWREVALKHIETARLQANTIETLMETGRTMDHVIRSLPPAPSDTTSDQEETE